MESDKPTALQRALEHYYSSGFWYGFLTGLATTVTVTAALARVWRKN